MSVFDNATYERAIIEAQDGKPRLFIEKYLAVRGKDNEVLPFRFARIIDDLDRNEGHYSITLKPRQVYVSTYHLAKLFAMCCVIPFFQAAVVSHEKDATLRLFRTVKNYHALMDPRIRPALDTDRSDYIEFPNKAVLYIGTAGGRKFGRSETINAMVISEMAHYQESDAIEIWEGAPEAVPQGGYIWIESTPKGIGNQYHNIYTEADERRNKYQAFFYPWFQHEEYQLGPDDAETLYTDRVPDSDIVPAPDELEVMLQYNLSIRQLRWRRSKKAEKREKFAQEYPEDKLSCFLATTNTVFPPTILQAMVREATGPKETVGPLSRWKHAHPAHQYVIGCDPAEGLDGQDASCAQVLDASNGAKVAVLHGQIPVQDFGRRIAELAREYNNATVIVERNNHGHALLLTLDAQGVGNLYRHREPGVVIGRAGFPTSAPSKTHLVAQLRAALEGGDVTEPDINTLRELMEFQVDASNRYGAPTGRHDDRAMALMLAVQGRLATPHLMRSSAVARRANVAYYEGA